MNKRETLQNELLSVIMRLTDDQAKEILAELKRQEEEEEKSKNENSSVF